jgi:2'-5' RNA ligase
LTSSGLVLLVPELAPVIDDLRARYDPAARQGMPAHVTVLYPFMPPVRMGPSRRRRLADAIRSIPAMELTFARIGRFPQVLWLAPEPAEPIAALVQAVTAAFPDYPPYGGQFETIVPHLTVAHGEGLDLAALEPELRARIGRPVTCRVDSVRLFSTLRGKWREFDSFALA